MAHFLHDTMKVNNPLQVVTEKQKINTQTEEKQVFMMKKPNYIDFDSFHKMHEFQIGLLRCILNEDIRTTYLISRLWRLDITGLIWRNGFQLNKENTAKLKGSNCADVSIIIIKIM